MAFYSNEVKNRLLVYTITALMRKITFYNYRYLFNDNGPIKIKVKIFNSKFSDKLAKITRYLFIKIYEYYQIPGKMH